MSWLHKFFDLFLGESEEDAERETKPAQIPKQPESHHSEGQLKRLEDPKIYYEYPKGKFRFPVVPDGYQKNDLRRRRPPSEEPQAEPRSSAAQHRDRTNNEKEHHTYEKSEPAKKPFKPTNIPSPVYGFNQKPSVKKDVPKQSAEKKGVQKKPEPVEEKVTLLSEEIERERSYPMPDRPPQQQKKEPLFSYDRFEEQPSGVLKSTNETMAKHSAEELSDKKVNAGDEMAPKAAEMRSEETEQMKQQEESFLREEKSWEETVTGAGMEAEKLSGNEGYAREEAVPETADTVSTQAEQTENQEPEKEEHFLPDERYGEEAVTGAETEAEEPSANEGNVREKAVPETAYTSAPTEEMEFHEHEKPFLHNERYEEETVADAGQEAEELSDSHTAAHEEIIPEAASAQVIEENSQPEATAAQINDYPEPEHSTEEDSPSYSAADESREEEVPAGERRTAPAEQQNRTEKSSNNPERSPALQKGPSVPFNVMMLKSDTHKQQKAGERRGSYVFPNVSLLDVPPAQVQDDTAWIENQRQLLDLTLKNFNVRANVVHVTQGPSVTRFEVHPEPGVKVNKITNLSDDIKLSLSARDIRIEAPIPGKNTIGIEVPNRTSKVVDLRQMIRSSAFRTSTSPLTAALGLDISGNPVVIDLKKMPHGLIAGATGSGKSVCINTILVSLLYKADPSEVKVLLIDPKMVELAPYNKIPHLVSPVITDAKAATAALKWVVEEMERRYELFAHSGVRDIDRFNQLTSDHQTGEKLPYLVVVIDELADLMMVAPNDVEESIARIAQKARACGIHLLVATQRPSVDVITGLIKANIPTRIAFSVSSQVDSRTIIDMAGAEKLLGKGDMLFLENGSGKPVRLQGNFVSDREIDRVVSHVRNQLPPAYLFEQEELVRQGSALKEEDELFYEACEFVVEQNSASTSSLQRRFRIGYNRAARLIDMMEAEGMISEAKGSKPREVLITASDLINE
ncbi:cell division protein FtsK [Bacillus halotolerans]|uniref:DNA translocase FtsK n=1 Tax=Bacillus halotolerans TaxID=260554 RepID=UPI000FDB444A|nr:DNA translocase FtsK [Bacillus halotolerans]AZV50494.1 cell division protein FtsK [Bacillus halotolerans]